MIRLDRYRKRMIKMVKKPINPEKATIKFAIICIIYSLKNDVENFAFRVKTNVQLKHCMVKNSTTYN